MSNPEYQVEVATIQDLPALMRMMEAGLKEMGFGFKDTRAMAEYLIGGLIEQDPLILVAVAQKKKRRVLLGMAVGDFRRQPFKGDKLIAYGHFIFVELAYRAGGIGMALLSAAERAAANRGAEEMFIEVLKDGAFSRRGYKQAYIGMQKELTQKVGEE